MIRLDLPQQISVGYFLGFLSFDGFVVEVLCIPLLLVEVFLELEVGHLGIICDQIFPEDFLVERSFLDLPHQTLRPHHNALVHALKDFADLPVAIIDERLS